MSDRITGDVMAYVTLEDGTLLDLVLAPDARTLIVRAGASLDPAARPEVLRCTYADLVNVVDNALPLLLRGALHHKATNDGSALTDPPWDLDSLIDASADPNTFVAALHAYYREAARAAETSRARMYLHVGMCIGMIARLQEQLALARTPAS